MATFGPALFQYFADTVQFDDEGFVIPYVQSHYVAAGFGSESEKIMDTFKNAIFKMIMLRARNEAIHNIECGRLNETSVFVDMHLELSDAHFHLDSDGNSKTPYTTPNQYSERVKSLPVNQINKTLPKTVSEGDRCSDNTRVYTPRVIHNDFASFLHDVIIDGTGEEISGTDLSEAMQECMKPMTCGASDALLNQHLSGDLAKYRTKP
ncbi:MAG: hypothetical protein ABJN22_08150 [Litorimonas sp.]